MILPLCCRWITGTAVDPTLPVQCTVEGSTLKLHGPPDLPQRQGLPPSAASLVALLVLATLVAGGALGRVLWWRKLRQRGLDSLQRGTHSAGSSRRLHSRPAGHTGTSIGPATAGGAPQPSKRARLAALVQAELGSAASGGIEMMPLDALPATLAHRLGSIWRHPPPPTNTPQGSLSSWAAAASAAAGQHLADEAHHLLAAPDESLLSMDRMGSREPAHARPQSTSQLGSRQWGLSTQSLRVRPGELQVRGCCMGGECIRQHPILPACLLAPSPASSFIKPASSFIKRSPHELAPAAAHSSSAASRLPFPCCSWSLMPRAGLWSLERAPMQWCTWGGCRERRWLSRWVGGST